MRKEILLLLFLVFLLAFLSFSFLAKAVDPGCSEQTPTCLGTYKVDQFICSQNANGKCTGPGTPGTTEIVRQATVTCPLPPDSYTCSYNICSSNDTITCTNRSRTIEGTKYYYCAESGCNTPGNCCGGANGNGNGDGNGGGCSDACSGYQLVDYNNDCVKNSSSCGGSTRYTGGECSVCPLNNNSCTSKYLDNTATSGNCVIPENMWSNIDKDFTISHNVTFPGSATLTIKRNLILNSGGKITVSSGATIVFYIGKEIRMQGGEISLTGGYILNQNP